MIRAKPWNGKDLKGTWQVTLKIDGVRALLKSDDGDESYWVSRADKPLYNLPSWRPGMPTDCEVYLGNFKDTIRAVRTRSPKDEDQCKLKRCACVATGEGLQYGKDTCCPNYECATPRILPEHLYSLDPLDKRLEFSQVNARYFPDGMTEETIRNLLRLAVDAGYEGLVLRQGDKWLKVKPEETHDVLVTGAIEGTGKHKGRLGALMTAKGKVGTGFSDEERHELWDRYLKDNGASPTKRDLLVGSTIEVSCMHFTPDGMFRHPRFVRLRPDKVASE